MKLPHRTIKPVPPLEVSLFERDLHELIELQYTPQSQAVKDEALGVLRALLWFAGESYGAMPMNVADQLFRILNFEKLSRLNYDYQEDRITFHETLSVSINGRDGILLATDTICDGQYLRHAHAHFNWATKGNINPCRYLLCQLGNTATAEQVSTGVWAVSAVVTDGIGYRLNELRKHGAFLWPWIAPPRIKIWHRRDELDLAGLDPKEIIKHAKARLKLIPMSIKKGMGLSDSWE
jgi:hypothetical protein